MEKAQHRHEQRARKKNNVKNCLKRKEVEDMKTFSEV